MNAAAIQDCWNRIGVQGDKSCPELHRHIHCRNCPKFAQGAHALLNRTPPTGYIGEWTQLLAQSKETADGFTDTIFVFRIGPEWLALNAHVCVEIVPMRPIRQVPHRSGQIFLGLTSVRGELRLCFALANLLGLEPAPKDQPRLLVVHKERSTMVFPVDEIMGLRRCHRDNIRSIPATVAHAVPQFSRGMLTADGHTIGLLDDELIFHALAKALA